MTAYLKRMGGGGGGEAKRSFEPFCVWILIKIQPVFFFKCCFTSTETVRPVGDLLGTVRPVRDLLGTVRPVEDLLGTVKPVGDLLGTVRPVGDLLGTVRPVGDLLGTVKPVGDLLGTVRPVGDLLGTVRPVSPRSSASTFTQFLTSEAAGSFVHCCFTSTNYKAYWGREAQDVHLSFHTTPEL